MDKKSDTAERPGGVGQRDGEPSRERAIDLTLPQVAASAVAAVIAAVVAGQLGVYGTFIGAGVMSLVATTGGPLFQHLFRRTGQQVKQVTVVAVRKPGAAARPTSVAADTTRPVPLAEGTVPVESGAFEASGAPASSALRRGWKRMLLPAVLVFAVAVTGLTVYELVSGDSVSGGKGASTSVGQVFGSGSSGSADTEQEAPRQQDDQPKGSQSPPESPGEAPSLAPGETQPTPDPQDGAGTPSTAPGDQEDAPDDGSGQSATPAPTPDPGEGAATGDPDGSTGTGGESADTARPDDGGGTEQDPSAGQAP